MTNLGFVLLIILLLGIFGLIPLIGAISVATCVVFKLPMWLSAFLWLVLYFSSAFSWFALVVKFEEWLIK